MVKTIFKISKMDCPSEENLIRMKLDGISDIAHLDFDIPNRKLTVYHKDDATTIEAALQELNLGAVKTASSTSEQRRFEQDNQQKKVLWWVMGINLLFFILEMITGFLSKSMGLVADSLDMLADSFVYGLSLLVVGRKAIRKKQVARLAGYFQMILAIMGFIEVIRRFVTAENLPDFTVMIVVSCLALIANGLCLYLLQQSKQQEEAHMQASMIFTSNDLLINLGVITAGVLVNLLHSRIPDLIIGIIIFTLVIRGALRILKLAR